MVLSEISDFFSDLDPAWIGVIGVVVGALISGPLAIYLSNKLKKDDKVSEKKMELGLQLIIDLHRYNVIIGQFRNDLINVNRKYDQYLSDKEKARFTIKKLEDEMGESVIEKEEYIKSNAMLFRAFVEDDKWYSSIAEPFIAKINDVKNMSEDDFLADNPSILSELETLMTSFILSIKKELKLYKT